MAPMYSDDQPGKSDESPVEQGDVHRLAVSQEILLKMHSKNAVLVLENEYQRFIRNIHDLDAHSSNWIAAAWALVGIAASLAGIALTVSGQLVMFGGFALLCGLGAFGCFVANRQVNQKHEDVVEALAREMEEAGDMDRVEIIALRPGESAPSSGPSP